jgi:hypothetical protein
MERNLTERREANRLPKVRGEKIAETKDVLDSK